MTADGWRDDMEEFSQTLALLVLLMNPGELLMQQHCTLHFSGFCDRGIHSNSV